jgi:hypothetical protein
MNTILIRGKILPGTEFMKGGLQGMLSFRFRPACLEQTRVTTSGFDHLELKLFFYSSNSNVVKICCFIRKLWPAVSDIVFLLLFGHPTLNSPVNSNTELMADRLINCQGSTKYLDSMTDAKVLFLE